MKRMGKKEKFIMALDEGTSTVRAIIWDHEINIKGNASYEISQIFPKPGWVEQDPAELWHLQVRATKDALRAANISANQIEAIGITNQRETKLIWDKKKKRVSPFLMR